MARRRIAPGDGLLAVRSIESGSRERQDVATAVRFLLEELAEIAPGKSVEVRVPPFGAVQCVGGLTHTRGTPPNVIEMNSDTWIGLALGTIAWDEAVQDGLVIASGSRADISHLLPVMRRTGGAPSTNLRE